MIASKIVIGAVGTLLLVGCSTQPSSLAVSGVANEQAVMDRAQARWDAARSGDLEKSYSFVVPSYRAVTDIKLYRAETAGSQSLGSAKVIGVKCESDTSCAARIRIEFSPPFTAQRLKPEAITNHFDESWVKEDGEWWLFKR